MEELNSTYIIDISRLPPYKESELRPDIEMTTFDHLQGWVDIVGFQNMANISGTLIIATLHAVLKWDTVSCDDDGCWISGSFTETHDWTDREISPPQFTFPDPQNMTIEQFPGFHPVSLIHFSDLNASIIFFNITTRNGSVEHLLNIGKVELTNKGIPYMNVTPFSVWGKTGKGIYHQGDDPIMDNETMISVFLWTPFGRAPDYNFSENAVYHQNKPTSINPAIGFIIYVVLIFLSGIYIMYRSSRFR